MTVVAEQRRGASVTIPVLTIDACPPAAYAEFADEMATICGFIKAAGGWWTETHETGASAPGRLVIACAGPRADVEELIELVGAFNARWSG